MSVFEHPDREEYRHQDSLNRIGNNIGKRELYHCRRPWGLCPAGWAKAGIVAR